MKNLFFALLVMVSFASCSEESATADTMDNSIEATILGRWIPQGFESNVRYDFTADKVYTVYASSDGVFPTEAEVIASNPVSLIHDWVYEGDLLVIDLNFGNFSRKTPTFKCGNHVVEWTGEDGTTGDLYYREGHDINECN